MSDILQVFSQVNQRINNLEMKLDAILLRLEICQKNSQKHTYQSIKGQVINPLDSYIGNNSQVSSFRGIQSKKEQKQDIMLLQSNYKSQPDNRVSTTFIQKQVKENIMDSKSFGIIKRSILINSEQIEHMKQRILQFQKQYIQKVISLEQGVEILTRLCSMIDQKVNQISPFDSSGGLKPKKQLKTNKNYQSHKLVQKYMKGQDQICKSRDMLFKYC